MINVEDYIGAAYKVASKFYSKNCDMSIDEINSMAFLGLLLAKKRFNEDKGVSFVTFAMKTIECEIKNILYRDKSKFIRKQIGGKETFERIYTDSLDRETNSVEGIKLIDCFGEEFNTDEYVENIDLKIAINKLNTYQRKIVKMLYFDEKTQRETAKILCINENTISREKKKILNLLREALTA